MDDNTGLSHALKSGLRVLPLFIFDTNITEELPGDDHRISFIYRTLVSLNRELGEMGSSLCVKKGDQVRIWEELTREYEIGSVFLNKDYEPYAIERDEKITSFLNKSGIGFLKFKDQVIFEETEILKSDNNPYTIFTPYKNRWIQKLKEKPPSSTYNEGLPSMFYQYSFPFPSLEELGFRQSILKVKSYDLSVISEYHKYRDLPAADRTSYLSPYLRFGTISIRSLVTLAFKENQVFLNELIWREFFMQILFHYPGVVTGNFRSTYDGIQWRNDEKDFLRWCNGETGYPFVDAGMRQLNQTGYMHNRVRMITAGFLCKHLLIDWRWGEAYFAGKLFDYELSSNNGNWQWAAGTGCDAAPYFRVFNPETQQKKFDPGMEYIRKWAGDTERSSYPAKIIDHEFARIRAIQTYRSGLKMKIF